MLKDIFFLYISKKMKLPFWFYIPKVFSDFPKLLFSYFLLGTELLSLKTLIFHKTTYTLILLIRTYLNIYIYYFAIYLLFLADVHYLAACPLTFIVSHDLPDQKIKTPQTFNIARFQTMLSKNKKKVSN